MTNETLRLQMLSGIITEGEYKAKLEELQPTEPQKGGSLQLKNAAMKIYSYIKKNGFTPYLMVDGKNIGDRMNHDFAIQVQGAGGHGASASLAADGLLTILGNRNKTNPQVMEKLQNDIIHDFPFLKKHYQSNPSGLVIKLAVDPKANVSETLNENFVGMGMVGNIFDREKTDYELAFEHFTKGTSLNENEDEMPEAPSHEETDANQVYEAEGDVSSEYLKEFKVAISKIMSDPKFKDVEEALGLNIDANGRNMGEVFQKVWDKAIKL